MRRIGWYAGPAGTALKCQRFLPTLAGTDAGTPLAPSMGAGTAPRSVRASQVRAAGPGVPNLGPDAAELVSAIRISQAVDIVALSGLSSSPTPLPTPLPWCAWWMAGHSVVDDILLTAG